MTYVVRCFKRIRRSDALLGNRGFYNEGDFVGSFTEGAPTKSLDRAALYGHGTDGDEFSFDLLGNDIDLADYFEKVPVRIAILKRK